MSTFSKHAFAMAVTLLLLTACGGAGSGDDKDQDPGVASISRPATASDDGSTSPAADAETGRPHLRMDTSDEESMRLWAAYWACLRDHHVPGGEKAGDPNHTWYVAGSQSKYPAAYKACLPKRPVIPWQIDSDRNPHYADDFRDFIKCQRKAGLKVHALPDYGEDYDSGAPRLSQSQEERIVDRCTRESFK